MQIGQTGMPQVLGVERVGGDEAAVVPEQTHFGIVDDYTTVGLEVSNLSLHVRLEYDRHAERFWVFVRKLHDVGSEVALTGADATGVRESQVANDLIASELRILD